MKVTTHGAAGEVTGSAYLLETDETRVLIDFGLFQSGRNFKAKNVLPAGLDPKTLDAVLVTHGHLDHVGRLPLLAKAGYSGPIFATQPTIELASLILRDSAKVQFYDIQRANRKLERAGKPLLKPLYNASEVDETLRLFRPVAFSQPIRVAKKIEATFAAAGHMLGSASISLHVEEGARRKRIVFSGDLGPPNFAIIRDSEPFKKADAVFLESTYGDRDHKPIKETLAEFRSIIERAVREKSRILVPAFAVGRTQQILYHLDELFCADILKPFPVFIDSPMAIEASKIYRAHPDLFDEEAKDLRRAAEVAGHSHVKATPTPEDSMALNDVPGPCLIMAGSGMCTGGRILHHFKHGLYRPGTAVMIVGYQAEGTLGRQLVDGAKSVKIFGEEIAVNAHIHTLNGFSAHAGQSDLLKWLGHVAHLKPKVALTHGEPRGRDPLASLIQRRFGIRAHLPSLGDSIEI